jgi:HD-GYP domain-containing protein (c-di-GMP phosphodiesterase class II)
MIRTIKTIDLKIGMYVAIPDTGRNHPFEKNGFPVKSYKDLQLIIDSGYTEVQIDTEKGMPIEDYEQVGHAQTNALGSREWSAENLVPDALCRALDDDTLPGQERAALVYESSRVLIERLFDDPRAENIKAARENIIGIVDMILARQEVATLLLRLTCHDFSTYSHSINVGILGTALAGLLYRGSDAHDMHELGTGFFLHDLGKVNIDPAIIEKQGMLTEHEMSIMRTHPWQGYKIMLNANQLSEECRIIAVQHHEREDGSGYPKRLKGDQIHPYARICCITDVYDALTSDRSYKPSLTPFEALKIMKEEMLHHFHKDLFDQFVVLLSGASAGKFEM